MSENPSTTLTPLQHPPTIADPHLQPHQLLHHIHNATTSASTSAPPLIREYRKGNWTLEETLTLITAKKLDDERRLKSSMNSQNHTKPAACRDSGELKWKWVENFCWSHGCFRSQNQCNDKWDNLLRDYKKVREHESKSDSSKDFRSYWSMDKNQRKQTNLPSNMLFDVYQAINDVLQRKYSQRTAHTHPLTMAMPSAAAPSLTQLVNQQPPQPLPPSAAPPPPPPLAPALSPSPPPPRIQARSSPELASESSGTDASENQYSETKRRKRRNIGSSILRSASVLARALQSCEEKKEKRHRELIELERRRLQMEETRNEVNRQGIANLVAAVTNLSGAIQSLISECHGRR